MANPDKSFISKHFLPFLTQISRKGRSGTHTGRNAQSARFWARKNAGTYGNHACVRPFAQRANCARRNSTDVRTVETRRHAGFGRGRPRKRHVGRKRSSKQGIGRPERPRSTQSDRMPVLAIWMFSFCQRDQCSEYRKTLGAKPKAAEWTRKHWNPL